MAFIVFEGIDHSGKSTLIKFIAKELNKYNINFILTREPGGTPFGEKIREIVLNPSQPISVKTEVLLMSANRRYHIDKIIAPALKKKQWIICDRFWPSTFAFQGAGRGIPEEQIKWLHNFIMPKNITPDLYILLDMSVDEKNKRGQNEEGERDSFESQDRLFHQKVKECYLSLAQKNKKNWLILNALLPSEELVKLIVIELKKRKWLNS